MNRSETLARVGSMQQLAYVRSVRHEDGRAAGMRVIEMKNGVEKKTDKKMFPGYVLVNMVMNDETWYVVRNTRGVTGFVGPGSKPVPLSEEEIRILGYRESEILVDFALGDTVNVTSGAWKDTIGVITEINEQKRTVTINVEMFGRDTPVELSYGEIQKLR